MQAPGYLLNRIHSGTELGFRIQDDIILNPFEWRFTARFLYDGRQVLRCHIHLRVAVFLIPVLGVFFLDKFLKAPDGLGGAVPDIFGKSVLVDEPAHHQEE